MIKGRKYYFDPESGGMSKGVTTIRGKKYFFEENGVLRTTGKVKLQYNY